MKLKREIDFDKNIEALFSILSAATDKEKELIADNCSCIFVPKRRIIFHEGDMSDNLICLTSGQVKVYKEGPAGRDWIMKMVNSVELIGYHSLFAEGRHNVSAMAIQDSVVCKVDKEVLFTILKKNSRLMMQMMKMLAEEVSLSLTKTITLTQKHIRGRLAETLLFLGETYGYEDDGKTVRVALSREDLANLSNMTTANAIRTLSAFSAEGYLSLDGRKIMILESDILDRISKMG